MTVHQLHRPDKLKPVPTSAGYENAPRLILVTEHYRHIIGQLRTRKNKSYHRAIIHLDHAQKSVRFQLFSTYSARGLFAQGVQVNIISLLMC